MARAEAIFPAFALPRKLWVGVRDFFFQDKRFVAGVALGLALLAGGYALSDTGGSGGSPSSDPSSATLGDTQTTMTAAQKEDAINCAKGCAGDPAGVGCAIEKAQKAHLELAAAAPNVEQLFDVNSDCFSGLSSIIDLSFAIPSLATIIAAAESAVMEYAKKKICSAVGRVTSMVTSPINQAIGTINGYIGDLNGLTGNLNGGGMTMIDPNLGSTYNIGSSGTYTTGRPFANNPQTPTDPNGGTDPNAGGNFNQVQILTQQLGDLQSRLGPAMQALSQAQQAYNMCVMANNYASACASQASSLAAAQQNVDSINRQIASIQAQIAALMGTSGKSAPASTGSASSGGSLSKKSSSDDSLVGKMGGLFQ